VDEIGGRDEAIAAARKLAGEDSTVVCYRRQPALFERLMGREGRSGALPAELETLARLTVHPRLLYLWRP